MIINLFFSYGVVFVRSDIRSAAHSSDGKDSDFESHHSVRVKRTLPEDIIEQNGIQPNNESEEPMHDAVTNATQADAASSKRFTVNTRFGRLRLRGLGRKPRLSHICFSKHWRRHVNLVNVCLTIRGWRRKKILFKGRYRIVRRWKRLWRVRIGKRWFRVRRTGRYQIYVINRWSTLIRRRGRWYVKYKGVFHTIIRQGMRWYIRYRRKLYRLRRKPTTWRIRFGRRWCRLKRRKRKFFMLYGKRWRPIRSHFKWRITYHGRPITVKRKGNRFQPRYGGRKLKWRRGYRRKVTYKKLLCDPQKWHLVIVTSIFVYIYVSIYHLSIYVSIYLSIYLRRRRRNRRRRRRQRRRRRRFTYVSVISQGFEDRKYGPGRGPVLGGRSRAYIKVNGVEKSLGRRGINVVVISKRTGRTLRRVSFDTHGSVNHAKRFYSYIKKIPYGSVVAVSVQDEAFRYGKRYLNVLKKIGAKGRNLRFGYRGSYALIGYKGHRRWWIREASRRKRRGPSAVYMRIPKTRKRLSISVESQGFVDKKRGRTLYGRSRAYIRVNGRDYSLHRRGFNVVVINYKTGRIEARRSFDTHGSRKAARRFKSFIYRIRRGRIVLIAIQDEAYRFGRYYKYVFRRLRINTRGIRLSYRSSLALIGYVGRRRPSWLKYMSRPQRRGPSYARIRIKTRGRLSFSVESQGFVDKKRGRTLYGRSRAYIRVNGRDYSLHRRGFNVVVVNYKTGRIEARRSFDTHGSRKAARRFKSFIYRIRRGRIVLIAIQDEAYRFGRYYKYVFGRLHINTRRIRLSYRSSLALIGYVGRRRPSWLRYMSRPQRRGPSYARIRIRTRGT
ncbi:unnamed protein product [Pocillopora meandrina]|uniref:ILEI/PANDER domain-containing protein n=1 Tax=Pocillopora meandrina TaxID=46732 RepID=A0AAU9WBB2_9CNID|nr:unnamed protein product [Pocillopora meandrina]